MDQSQQVKEQIKFDVERAVGKVFRKKPIKAISEDSKGFKFSLGYGKDNRRVWQRNKTHEEAQIFKSLWNKGVHQKDETLLEALTEERAYRTKLAKIGLEGLRIFRSSFNYRCSEGDSYWIFSFFLGKS